MGLTRRLPAVYRAICDEQAKYAPVGARGCPPLVPAGEMRVDFAGPFSRLERLRGGYSADMGSAVLDELKGERLETNGGHWHYDVDRRRAASLTSRVPTCDSGARRCVGGLAPT